MMCVSFFILTIAMLVSFLRYIIRSTTVAICPTSTPVEREEQKLVQIITANKRGRNGE